MASVPVRALASHTATARLALGLVGALARRLPSGLNKRRLVNLMRSVQWPVLDLASRAVGLTDDVQVRLTPHVGEFDFEALFYDVLPYERQVFETLRARIPDYDAVVEIGANVGVFTLFFSAVFAKQPGSRARVYAFEPSREAFLRLLGNLADNAVDNVDAFNAAVAPQAGFVDFFEPDGHLTNGSLSATFASHFAEHVRRTRAVAVDAAMIDALVHAGARMLIKIDAEGADAAILRSLEPLIVARRPDLVVEVLPDEDDAFNALAFLPVHYRLFLITDKGLVERSRFEASDEHRDYLLVPRREAPDRA